MTLHREGYREGCGPPEITRRWKEGQVWACNCGNMFKVVVSHPFGHKFIEWAVVK